jgi:hypothetical protein
VAAEEVPQEDVIYNPPGITISNSSISWGFFANNNMTVTVTNQSGQTLTNTLVLVSVPGTSGNYTDKNGVAWMFTLGGVSPLELSPCSMDRRPVNLTSGGSCSATFDPLITTPFGSPFRYSVEVRGRLGSHYSVTKETFTYSLSTQEENQLWVRSFIKLVNAARNG